jgi:hypothetical protein
MGKKCVVTGAIGLKHDMSQINGTQCDWLYPIHGSNGNIYGPIVIGSFFFF